MGVPVVIGQRRADRVSAPWAEQAAARFDTVDLLRGLSILGVVLLHASLWLSFGGYAVGASLPKWLRYVVFSQGGNGVSAFFAISGFLITYVSVRRFGSLARMQAGRFYRIRFARIFPLLALLLILFSALHFVGPSEFRVMHGKGTLGGAVMAALTFRLNWYEAVHGWLPAPWTVLWSLSVEEMFYLFFPLVCIALLRWRGGRVWFLMVLVGLVVFGPFARQPWYTRNEIWLYQSYFGNLDNVAMGCLFALLTIRLERTRRLAGTRWPRVCEGVGTLLTLFVVVWDWPRAIFDWRVKRMMAHSATDVTVLGLGVCLILLGSVLRRGRGLRWTAPVRWLGRYSYEVYLSHEFVVMGVLSLFLRTRRGPVGLWVVATVVLSAMLGALLSRLYSEPMNRLLRGAPVSAELRAKHGIEVAG